MVLWGMWSLLMIYSYSQVHSEPEVPVRVTSMNQIKICNHTKAKCLKYGVPNEIRTHL